MTSPQQDGDSRRPRITRTTSLFAGARAQGSGRIGNPPSGSAFGTRGGDPRSRPMTEYQRRVAEAQEAARRRAAGAYSPDDEDEPTRGSPTSFYRDFINEQLNDGSRLKSRIAQSSTTSITATEEQLTSVTSPLDMAGVDPKATFLFDRAAPIDPATGERTGVLQSRGVFGSADSLERQLPQGETITTGKNENQMTIGAGVLWLRNLAARDPDAYNRLVVLLRNAGYGNLPNEDAALPLNGYTNQVGAAFALAANDLAQANVGGDNRTLMEYLSARGQGYADLLAQQAADAAAEEAYDPINREYQDPATLKAAAKAAAIEALGRALTDEEEARFEAHFRSLENKLYDEIDAAGEAETKWSGYAPDVTGQADAFLDSPQFEQESANNLVGSYAQSFMRMMGVGG